MTDSMSLDLSSDAVRVLGVLIEKEFTTPDNYPLTLNSLLSGCNQSTNRNPVVSYDEMTIERALGELREEGLALRGVYAGSRVPKHRQVFNERYSLSKEALAVLAVLLLRGEQTLGEIKSRTERMVDFQSLDACENAITELVDFTPCLAERIAKHPGQKEGRITHSLGGKSLTHESESENVVRPAFQLIEGELADQQGHDEYFDDDLEDRIDKLEKEVTVLTHEIMSLRAEIDDLKDPSA